MKQTITFKIALVALIGACAGVLFLSVPQYSSAHGNDHDTHASSTKKDLRDRMKNASSSKERGKNVDATCMQGVMDTREDALVTAWGTFNDDIVAGLTARKTAIYTAWGLTDVAERNVALVKAWKDWKKTSKDAHSDLRKAKKSAWDAFKKTAKESCKITAPKDEALGKDASGEIAL